MHPFEADPKKEQVARISNLLKAGLLDMARSVLPHACWSDPGHCCDTRGLSMTSTRGILLLRDLDAQFFCMAVHHPPVDC